jgi:hypothetical protein
VRLLAATIALLLIAGVATGCGGDDNDSNTTTTAPASEAPSSGTTGSAEGGDKGEKPGEQAGGKTGGGSAPATTPTARRKLIKQADKGCRGSQAAELRLESRIAQQLTRLNPEQSSQTARIVGQEAELLRTDQAKLNALQVAAKDRPKLRRLVQAYSQRIAQLTGLRRALLRRDLGGALTLNTRSTAMKALQRSAARDFGFEVCGVARVGPPTG